MAEYGIDMPEADTYKYEGMRGVETIQIVVKQQQGRDISEEEAQEMYDEKARLFGLMPEAPIMEGVKELMTAIKADGMQIGIVTGSGQRPLIQRVLDDFADFVDERHIVCAYDVRRASPHPTLISWGLPKQAISSRGRVLSWRTPRSVSRREYPQGYSPLPSTADRSPTPRSPLRVPT